MKCTACGARLVPECPSNVLCSDDCLDAFVAAPLPSYAHAARAAA